MVDTCFSCNKPNCKLFIYINNYVTNKNDLFLLIPDFCKNFEYDRDTIRKF